MDIKYELIPYDKIEGSQKFDFDKTIYDLNSQIELLSSQADKLDYIVAIASGIACGLLDIIWVGEFNLENGRNIASDKVDYFVKKTAEMLEGEKFSDVKSAVRALEKKFPIPSDGNTSDFGGGPTPSARFCSSSDYRRIDFFAFDTVYREIFWNRCKRRFSCY